MKSVRLQGLTPPRTRVCLSLFEKEVIQSNGNQVINYKPQTRVSIGSNRSSEHWFPVLSANLSEGYLREPKQLMTQRMASTFDGFEWSEE